MRKNTLKFDIKTDFQLSIPKRSNHYFQYEYNEESPIDGAYHGITTTVGFDLACIYDMRYQCSVTFDTHIIIDCDNKQAISGS